mgnify:FL=1
MTTVALCGHMVSDAGYREGAPEWTAEPWRAIYVALHAHYRASRECDRTARIAFKRLKAKWGTPLRPAPEG